MNEGRETVWFRRVRHRRKIFLLDVCSLDARQAVQPDPTHCSANPYGILAPILFHATPSIHSISAKPFRVHSTRMRVRSKADGLRRIRTFLFAFSRCFLNFDKMERQFLVIYLARGLKTLMWHVHVNLIFDQFTHPLYWFQMLSSVVLISRHRDEDGGAPAAANWPWK